MISPDAIARRYFLVAKKNLHTKLQPYWLEVFSRLMNDPLHHEVSLQRADIDAPVLEMIFTVEGPRRLIENQFRLYFDECLRQHGWLHYRYRSLRCTERKDWQIQFTLVGPLKEIIND